MKSIIIWALSFLLSALVFIPCIFLSILSGFEIDYHHRFCLYWYDKVLSKF